MRQALSALFLLSLLAVAAPAMASESPEFLGSGVVHAGNASAELPSQANDGSRKSRTDSVDYQMNAIRTGILVLGFAVYAWGFWLPRSGSEKLARLRLAALLILAAAAYASYYQFFQYSHVRGFATTDNFHYYVGSKYFDELGYFGLYECSLIALAEKGLQPDRASGERARDLRSMELGPYSGIKENGADCPRRFEPERWDAFADDVAFFAEAWPDHLRRATWRDHGFHPSPSWILAGSGLANLAPLREAWVAFGLSRLDRILIALTFALVAWTFGIETACLVMLIWGTGCLWRYTWVGDAFLRHLWWITAIGGVAALRRGLPLVGGAALAASGMVRLFPAALGLGYALRALQQFRNSGRVEARYRRFTWGAALTLGALAVAGLLALAPSVYTDFALKITRFNEMAVTNQIGLGVVLQPLAGEVEWAAAALRILAIGLFLGLFWRALHYTRDWEAAALGASMIPIILAPTNYYYSFFLVVALLALERPRIGCILLTAATAWNINGLILYREYEEFFWASIIAVATSFFVVLEVATSKKTSGDDQEKPDASSTALRSQAPISG